MKISDLESAAGILEERIRSLRDAMAEQLLAAPRQLRVEGHDVGSIDNIVESYVHKLCYHDACLKLLRVEISRRKPRPFRKTDLENLPAEHRVRVVQLECTKDSLARTISDWLTSMGVAVASIRNISLLEESDTLICVIVYDHKTSMLECTDDEAEKVIEYLNRENSGADDSSRNS